MKKKERFLVNDSFSSWLCSGSHILGPHDWKNKHENPIEYVVDRMAEGFYSQFRWQPTNNQHFPTTTKTPKQILLQVSHLNFS